MLLARKTQRLVAVLAAVVCLGLAVLLFRPESAPTPQGVGQRRFEPASGMSGGEPTPLAGSESCRECHEVFFRKWSTSFHGLAMQPHTGDFARDRLTPQEEPLVIKGRRYRAVIGTDGDHVEESGPDGEKTYPIVQVLGGKNVCYFLTPLGRGHLQVLPVAYDMNRREWYSTAGSAVRHFEDVEDEELDWTDRAYTFNTSCFSCHVSQLATNYEPATDSYRTVWAEPGVSCETCHGPAGEHVRTFEGLKPGEKPADMKIISARSLTSEQRNDLCSSCHAKASPLWFSFRPGDRFYDHFDLITLESPDYHPDGRDLGENYTLTSWSMSPCVRSGKLDCVHCHTSSGRFRFEDRPDDSCLPCHEERVRTVAAHSHHLPESAGSRCIACHMPMTEFARMHRSDHSMRPPSPAASLELGSPNACTICHRDKEDAWASEAVRTWHGEDYESRALREGRLVAAARKGDCSRLPELLEYLGEEDRDEIVTTSLVRLLHACDEPAKWPALRRLASDPSPLVRAAAVAHLEADRQARATLVAATRDDVRLVRVRAVAALGALDPRALDGPDRAGVEAAVAELEHSLLARPDDYASHYNLGNLHLERGEPAAAVVQYRKAVELRPDHVASLVNLSMAEARRGRMAAAEEPLRRAIRVEPRNAAAHFNLGLLLAETGRRREAQESLRRALDLDPQNASAAYNLAVLVADADPREAAGLAAQAASSAPREPRYAWTQAYYLQLSGDAAGAARALERLVVRYPGYRDGWALLGAVLEGEGRPREAREVYRRAARTPSLSNADRAAFEARARGAVPR